MIRAGLLLPALFLPLAALADTAPDYSGIYNAACTKDVAQFAITITADTIDYYESTCTLSDPQALPGFADATLYSAACTGEGQEWVKPLIIMAGLDGGLVLVDDGYAATYLRCDVLE